MEHAGKQENSPQMKFGSNQEQWVKTLEQGPWRVLFVVIIVYRRVLLLYVLHKQFNKKKVGKNPRTLVIGKIQQSRSRNILIWKIRKQVTRLVSY